MLKRSEVLYLLQSQARDRIQFAAHAHYAAKYSSATTKLRSLGETTASSQVQEREYELRRAGQSLFPRVGFFKNAVTCANFHDQYAYLRPDQSHEADTVILQGMNTQRLINNH